MKKITNEDIASGLSWAWLFAWGMFITGMVIIGVGFRHISDQNKEILSRIESIECLPLYQYGGIYRHQVEEMADSIRQSERRIIEHFHDLDKLGYYEEN